jgi:DnaK suppressor protein
MDEKDIAAFRELLLAREAALRGEVRSHRDQLVEPASATGNTFVAGVEGATADSDDERELALLRHAQNEYNDVVAALARIDQGGYGDCESCGGEIGEARLRARPEARLCRACQDAAEHHTHRLA